MVRMLTLAQRSLVSDRPLPVQPLPGEDTPPAPSVDASNEHASCASVPAAGCSDGALDPHGYPTATSFWAAAYATREQPAPSPATAPLAQLFSATVHSLHEGEFLTARERLHNLCVFGKHLADQARDAGSRPSLSLAEAATAAVADADAANAPEGAYAGSGTHRATLRSSVHDAHGLSAADAPVLDGWVGDCATLLQYMPAEPPSTEDHKRLHMLLHDLGGSLLNLYLLGVLTAPLLPAAALGALSRLLGNSFGEWNRRTALTRALALAETEAGAQLDAVAILREAGLCTPLAPTQPGSRAGADARTTTSGAWWACVPVPRCCIVGGALVRRWSCYVNWWCPHQPSTPSSPRLSSPRACHRRRSTSSRTRQARRRRHVLSHRVFSRRGCHRRGCRPRRLRCASVPSTCSNCLRRRSRHRSTGWRQRANCCAGSCALSSRLGRLRRPRRRSPARRPLVCLLCALHDC